MTSIEPDIAVGALRKLLETLPGLGVEPGAVCAAARFDLAAVEGPEARVPLRTLYALWEALLERLPRADAALVVAQHYAPGDYGLVGFVCMCCPTLGAALRQVTRYSRLWASQPELRLQDDGWLEVIYTSPSPDRPGLRLATEAALAELLNAMRLVAQQPVAPTEVCFTHRGPVDLAAHRAFFGCPVRFGAPRTGFHLTPGAMELAVPRADPQLGAYLDSLARQALSARATPESALHQLRRLLAEDLRTGVPDLEGTARRMATSARTLRRRLDAEGTTFREQLDTTRAELAQSYLANLALPLAEVAFLLGFSEVSAFHRAFKRWTGRTPAEFRLEAGPGVVGRQVGRGPDTL